MNKLNVEDLKKVVLSVLLIIIGILFCCSLAMGIDGLSVVIGLTLMVAGVLMIVSTMLNSNGILNIIGLIGVVIISFGLLFIVNKLAGVIIAYIPWLLLVFGIVLIVDTFLGKFIRKESNNLNFIIKLVVGIVAFVLGLCLLIIDGFLKYSSIIVGIVMIIYAIYLLFLVFLKKNN